MGRHEAARDRAEERPADVQELLGLRQLQQLLQLAQVEHALGRVGGRPVLQQAEDHRLRQRRVLLHELRHACADHSKPMSQLFGRTRMRARGGKRGRKRGGRTVGELLLEGVDVLGLVERDERLDQERLVLLLQRQRKAVDDRAQDLEQLRDAVVVVALVDEAVEGVVDGAPDEGAVRHELAVHPVQDRLEVVPLARILRVEQLQHRDDRGLIDVSLRHLRVDIARDDEAEEELVDELQVGPGRLQERLVLLRVKVRVEVALPWRERSEQVRFDLQTRQSEPHVNTRQAQAAD